MKKLSFLLFLTFIFGCNEIPKLPKESRIVAKYIVFNNEISSKTIRNLNDVERLKDASEITSEFKLGKEVFDLEYTFILFPEGHLEKIHEYKFSNNYYFYKKHKITFDTIDRENIGKGFLIKLNHSKNEVIDGKDTFKIKSVYPIEKLIRVDEDDKNGRIKFYQYY